MGGLPVLAVRGKGGQAVHGTRELATPTSIGLARERVPSFAGGGFVLCAGDNIGPRTARENVETM